MFHAERIANFDRPGLQPYATMRRPQEQRDAGIFVAEGTKVVHRLLESDFGVVSAVLPEEMLPEFEPLLSRRPELVHVYIAEKPMLEALTGFHMFQGVLAVGRIPERLSLDDALQKAVQPRLIVAIEGVSNAENVGVLVRNSAAFGAGLLVIGETCASPFLRRAVRNSMGAIFQLPVLETRDLVQTLHEFQAAGIRCIAAHPHPPSANLPRANLRRDCCLVFGSEGDGLSPGTLGSCQEAACIPMAAGVDSLNVANAAAVFLYEALRQRDWGATPA